jgi:hypothetical protein
MSFKIRSKPVKPVRKKNVKYTNHLWDGDNLAQLNDWVKKHGVMLEDVTIEKEFGYYSEVEVYAVIHTDELKEDFQKRVDNYNTRKKQYDDWYKKYEKSILKELERRKKVAIEEEEDRKKKEKIKLQKKLKEISKKLERMK